MKKSLLLTAACLATLLHVASAEDVALMTVQIGKGSPDYLVALKFYDGDAPRTVENFKKLAKKGFYKGIAFHRAFPNTLVQAGDPASKDKKEREKVGIGGPGYTIVPEIRRKHTKGALAAARLPDKINPSRMSNGSQFFVCLAPQPSYDGQYTVFGNVIYGLDVLDIISNKPVDSNDYPIDRCIIRSIKVLPREQLPPEPAPASPSKKTSKPWWKIFG